MELQPFLLKITYLLVILLFITFRIIVASFSTILTNHDGYTIIKNLTTHTYTECYLYCKRTPGCDDVEVTYGDDGKNEQRRCLILKLRKIEADCSRKVRGTNRTVRNKMWLFNKWFNRFIGNKLAFCPSGAVSPNSSPRQNPTPVAPLDGGEGVLHPATFYQVVGLSLS